MSHNLCVAIENLSARALYRFFKRPVRCGRGFYGLKIPIFPRFDTKRKKNGDKWPEWTKEDTACAEEKGVVCGGKCYKVLNTVLRPFNWFLLAKSRSDQGEKPQRRGRHKKKVVCGWGWGKSAWFSGSQGSFCFNLW